MVKKNNNFNDYSKSSRYRIFSNTKAEDDSSDSSSSDEKSSTNSEITSAHGSSSDESNENSRFSIQNDAKNQSLSYGKF